MKILVCIKQVPDDSVEVHLKSDGKKVELSSIEQIINPFDTYALEMATRLKEKNGGEITVLSIGDESVKNSLKNCLAVGADKAVLIKYDNNDNLLSNTQVIEGLIKGKELLENQSSEMFDLIFLGKESTDFSTSQIGNRIAERLNYPVVTNVVDIEIINDKIQVKQEREDGYNIIEMPLKSIITVQKPNYEPRYPTIKTKMAARKKAIDELSITIEEIEPKSEILKVYEPQKKKAGTKIKCDDLFEAVDLVIKHMKDSKVL